MIIMRHLELYIIVIFPGFPVNPNLYIGYRTVYHHEGTPSKQRIPRQY